MRRFLIPSFDGLKSERSVIDQLVSFINHPSLAPHVTVVKFNDALHFPHIGPDILRVVNKIILPEVGIFVDMKIAEVGKTMINIIKKYVRYNPSIITVTSNVSLASLRAIKEILPSVKVALYDTPTDMSMEECLARYGMTPLEKIYQAITGFESLMGGHSPIDMVVCSAWEMEELIEIFGDRYRFIVPGIRDDWMAGDYQSRRMGVYDVLKKGKGLCFPVMSTQLFTGNPSAGISAEESQRLTQQEIDRFFAE
jgi:orotidine-5'-phosphate decarboxylase